MVDVALVLPARYTVLAFLNDLPDSLYFNDEQIEVLL